MFVLPIAFLLIAPFGAAIWALGSYDRKISEREYLQDRDVEFLNWLASLPPDQLDLFKENLNRYPVWQQDLYKWWVQQQNPPNQD